MTHFFTWLALFEISIVSVASLFYLGKISLDWHLRGMKPTLIFIFLSVLMLIPFGSSEIPLAAYVRGVTGDLSVISYLLILNLLLGTKARLALLTPYLFVCMGLCFYPFALGLSMFDPYAWGYGDRGFVLIVLAIGLLYLILRHPWETCLFSFAVIAWALHWHESNNLWDYILDPFLFFWAIGISLRWSISGRREPKVTYRIQRRGLFRSG